MMERVVYLDRGAVPVEVRRPAFDHQWVEYPTTRPEEVKARLAGATIAITHRLSLKGEDLPHTLRLIAVGATGYERIDLAACRRRAVHVQRPRLECVRSGAPFRPGARAAAELAVLSLGGSIGGVVVAPPSLHVRGADGSHAAGQ
jgi:phosphoglycerate dehydrogenase-like enzyme